MLRYSNGYVIYYQTQIIFCDKFALVYTNYNVFFL